MKCPYCNSKMIIGSVTTGKQHGTYFLPLGCNDDFKITYFATPKGATRLSQSQTRLNRKKARVEAWQCVSCQKIIISYNDDIKK